jgi:hypothetical protein
MRGVNRWTRERLQREHDLSNIPGMSSNTPPEEMPDRQRGPAPPGCDMPVCFAAVPVADVQPTATREPTPVPSLATEELSPRCAVTTLAYRMEVFKGTGSDACVGDSPVVVTLPFL